MTVFMQDKDSFKAMPKSLFATVIENPDLKVAESATNLFVFSAATRLSNIEEFVQAANRHHHLRALFVQEDVDRKMAPANAEPCKPEDAQKCDCAFRTGGPEARNVRMADRAQEKLIANAVLSGDKLFVVNCALEQFEVSFGEIRALDDIPAKERASFKIAEDGSYIVWPDSEHAHRYGHYSLLCR